MEKLFCVYMMASKRNGTLYVGVTSELPKRVWEHRDGVVDGFSKEHGIKTLVWYEVHGSEYPDDSGWIPAFAGMTFHGLPR
jgi:putative endonuclease